MTDRRGSDFPAASAWSPTATFLQDDPAGTTEKVTPAQVEAKLEADGFIKAASPSLGQVAAYTAGGWAPIKLADANIDAAAAIGWGKISKSGAVATDVGALPSLTISGDVDANSINSGAPCIVKFQSVTSWTNFPFANALLMSGKGGAFTQLVGKDSGVSQCWTDLTDGGTYRRNYVTAYGWSPWYTDWDSYNLPVGSTGKALLATASQAAARSAISALPIANPTATGTLTAPDVVVSNLAGTGTRPAAIDSTGKLVVGMFTAKDCLSVYTTAPTAAPNYIRANSYTGTIAASASYRGSLKGIVDGSTVSVKFTIGGVTVAGGDQLDFVNGGPFVLEWWLETYAPGADAFLNFRMTIGSYSSDRLYCSLNQFVAPSLGSSDDLKIEFKIGNTSVTVRTMSEVVERIG